MADPMTRPTQTLSSAPRVATIGYLLALGMLGPALSPYVGVWGDLANEGSVLWRFGIYGQLATSQFYVLVSLALFAVTAAAFGHRGVLRATGIVAIVLAVLLAAGGPFFALDYLQVKKSMTPIAFAPFKSTAFKVVGMAFLSVIVLITIAVATFRAARVFKDSRPPRGPAAPLGVGRAAP